MCQDGRFCMLWRVFGGFLAVGGSCGGLLGRERDTGRAAAA